MIDMRRAAHNSASKQPTRRAAVAFEFLLALPVALGMVFAIAEFGILLASVKFVEMAAFEGAREAAKLEKPHLHRAAGVARYRADRVLNSSGLGGTCAVFVRHNVPGGSNRYTKHGKCPCGPRWVDLPNHHKVAAVECTVKVPMPHLTPNLLAFFGFSTKGRHVSASHTVPYLRGH